MPSALTHLLLLDETTAKGSPAFKNAVAGHPIHAAWGSVGPDFLFFHPKDWSGFGPVMEFIFRLQNELREVKRVFDQIDDFVGDVSDFLTGGLHSELQRTSQYLQTTLLTAVAAGISTTSDYFRYFESPAQKYQPIPDWWWMDITHNFRVGRFCEQLQKHAGTDPALRAYVAGYITHVAGDVVVHPFVNLIAGGAYRSHARRHVLIEKALDTHLLNQQLGLNISNCEWHKRIDFSGGTDPYPRIPDPLARMLNAALRDTYSSLNIKSGIPSEDEIGTSYRFFYEWMKGVTGEGLINLGPPPAFDPLKLPQEILNVITSPAPGIPGGLPQSEADWRALLLALFAFLEWCIRVFAALVALSYTVFMQLTTLALRYVQWLLQRFLYEIYRKARLILAIGAYVHPATEDIDHFSGVTRGLTKYREWSSPWQKYRNSDQTYHLIHPARAPGASLEAPKTSIFSLYAGPLTNGLTFDDATGPLFGSAPTGPMHDHLGICALGDMNATNAYVSQGLGFVSAARLGSEIYSTLLAGTPLPNWNLDGDRGISWPSWHAAPPPWNSAADFKFEC